MGQERAGRRRFPRGRPWNLLCPPSLAFPRDMDAEGHSGTHSGTRPYLKRKITSPTFGIRFLWFQFHDEEMREPS